MTAVVQTGGLGKRYGKRWALENIELSIEKGEIVGFIGPNGAGKTTLISILAGLMRPSAGTVHVATDRIGVISDRFGCIPHLSGRANLELLADIQNRQPSGGIAQCLSAVGLDPNDKRPVKSYSLGMQQRLMIAQAMIVEPELLLLDEPTNGLDPEGIVLLRKWLLELSEKGVAIFLASHLLTEVEKLCRRVILVNHGKILKEIRLDDTGTPDVGIVFSSRADYDRFKNLGTYEFLDDVNEGKSEQPRIRIAGVDDLMPLMECIVAERIAVEEIGRQRLSLERAFLELLK
ncbi:MAG: ABC transporter ATP-binding protein [Polyangiaceae bacterium]|nr:ABC transporter ATP-binding protein [Polyangiaceae bacterium]